MSRVQILEKIQLKPLNDTNLKSLDINLGAFDEYIILIFIRI